MLYVSDHGESLGENGIYLHAAPYMIAPEEQTRIPMLVWLDRTTPTPCGSTANACAKKQPAAGRTTTSFILCSALAESKLPYTILRSTSFPAAAKNNPRLFSLPDENLYHKAGKEKQT